MNYFKLLIIALMLSGSTVALSAVSYADDANDQAKIKSLNEAASALQQLNPDLAAGLTKFADEEAAEVKGKEDEKKAEMKGAKEENEAAEKSERLAHIKLLRDSGSALKTVKPELALSLMEMADKGENKMMNREPEEKGEKQEKDK
ncbi:MAG: hypothetical protein KGK03_09985 [Candidatus Omnitrophica bacterium]|nr:hypothetical protein [Candidatus Omnitrophota bacterium]MDE2223381.1 hypothetical protein [Candidatus Omnitrophota bacterium]